jgi:hypothetical protein
MRAGTVRNTSRKTDGNIVAKYAELLGTPLLPWQQYVADVAGEIDPETGTYFYDTVVLSTPRQCGKSTLVDTEDTRNTQWGPDRFVYYLAQTGKFADDHFKEYLKKLEGSRLAQIARRPKLSNGAMQQEFHNGSVIKPMAVTKVAGHGVQGDKITLDEAFSLTQETGQAIIDGFLPTTATRYRRTGVQPQVWITSTEGTADSTFFNPIIDGFRSGEVPAHTCWFDWGIPQNSDPEDLDNIWKHHPAAGLLWDLRQLKQFREGFRDDVAGWARAFGNRRDTGIVDRVIPADLWNSTVTVPVEPEELNGRKTVIAAAVDMDATNTSVAVGIHNDDDTTTVQLVDVLPGTGEAPNILRRLCTQYQAPIIMDNRGPNADLRDRLEAMKDDYDEPIIEFVQMQAVDYLATGQSFVSGLQNGVILHANDPDLDASAAVCARTWSGDAWRITRRGTTGMTSPLESAILAAWGISHMPEKDGGLQIF